MGNKQVCVLSKLISVLSKSLETKALPIHNASVYHLQYFKWILP